MVVSELNLSKPALDCIVVDFGETRGNWGPVLDGVSSWESAWPQIVGSDPSKPGDISKDEKVLSPATGRNKEYMIGASTQGIVNLPNA